MSGKRDWKFWLAILAITPGSSIFVVSLIYALTRVWFTIPLLLLFIFTWWGLYTIVDDYL